MIVVHASVPVRPERREEALERVATLADETRAEDGVLDYAATTDVQEPNVVRFFEQYEDEAALEAHQRTDHYRTWTDALPDVLDGGVEDVEVTQFVVEEAFDPNADANPE
ncbi:putative quinol monooxygenase [Halorussus salinisoli]|uniref:putative quinol monooxygenase n=1 Tax=Halorussus salinisoli TaxID=2558242 RepID=UPI0010C1B330|nr:putative quinol monooxygenase [Halorussus salinisoli]